ncbi:MAG: CesT family type III secretion system chaperone [Victivallales bacterium]|nr:CesT family type III secretion system chaperone [Victivallales bacterium]
MPNALENLCEAIAYPDPVPPGAAAFTLYVDGNLLSAQLLGGRLVLSREISREEADLQKLASYAAGRLLREEAVLAWDENTGACILWQECPANASSAQLLHFFETFLASCDWWLARVAGLAATQVSFPELVIVP